MVEAINRVTDGTVESAGIGKGAVGEPMLLEVTPASFDVIQLGRVFWQPLEGRPHALAERARCQLAAVDRSVVENRHQGPGSFEGAVRGARLNRAGRQSRWSA
jgi:hypothetical protein